MQQRYAQAQPTMGGMQKPQQPVAAVNHFAQFIEQQGIERRGHLQEFKGKKMGVDGAKILENINQVMRETEKLATLTSPIPYCAYNEMSYIVEALQFQGISADYVFPGMGLTFSSKDKERTKTQDHNETILSLIGRTVNDPARMNKAAEELQVCLDEDAENYIFLYMKLFPHVTVTRAPYWSWAQLASYFNGRTTYVDCVYGCYELLAFRGIEKLITRIDPVDGSYRYVLKQELLGKLIAANRGVPIAEADLPFIVGATSSHKLLNDPYVTTMSVQDVLGRAVRDPQTNQLLFPPAPNALSQQQERAARCVDAIQLCPVLLPDGRCVPLCMAFDKVRFSKRRLLELFGEPLPPMYYFMQMSGLLSPSVLSTVATKKIVDAIPVVDSPEYRTVAEFIIPLRTQIVYQLVQSLQHNQIEITWVRRYNRETNSRELPILQPPQIRLDQWNTQSVIGVQYFTDVLPFAQLAVNQCVYRSTSQAHAAVLLKILDLLGYFTHATQTNSTEVSGPSVYSTALEYCKIPSLSEYAVLLIELIRTKTLTERCLFYQPKSSSARPPPLAGLDPSIIFASRLLSIVPLRLKQPWTGPICADLCGFSGMARSVQRTLRSLAEVITVITHCENTRQPSAPFTVAQYQLDVQAKLPFSTPLMCAAGVVVQYMMSNVANLNIDSLEKAFPDCLNLREDLSSLFYFWFYAGQIIKVLYEDDQHNMQGTYAVFQNAHVVMCRLALNLLGPMYTFLNEV